LHPTSAHHILVSAWLVFRDGKITEYRTVGPAWHVEILQPDVGVGQHGPVT
jgi:hypothetical protein